MKKILFAIVALLLCQSIANADIFEYLAKEDPSYELETVDEEPLPQDALKILNSRPRSGRASFYSIS